MARTVNRNQRQARRQAPYARELTAEQLTAIAEDTQHQRIEESTTNQYKGYVARYLAFSNEQGIEINPQNRSYNEDLQSHLLRFFTFFADGNIYLSVSCTYLTIVFLSRENAISIGRFIQT
jgi:hypothetical protein